MAGIEDEAEIASGSAKDGPAIFWRLVQTRIASFRSPNIYLSQEDEPSAHILKVLGFFFHKLSIFHLFIRFGLRLQSLPITTPRGVFAPEATMICFTPRLTARGLHRLTPPQYSSPPTHPHSAPLLWNIPSLRSLASRKALDFHNVFNNTTERDSHSRGRENCCCCS